MRTELMFVIMLASAGISSAHAAHCSARQAENADAAIDTMTNWTAVHNVYERFAQCDDGSIAEGFSDAIAKVMVDQWRTLPRLASLTGSDPRFNTFILNHIDSTLDIKQLETIHRLSAGSCPARATKLCRSIAAAARQASRE